jgi:hypothetical protein
MNRIQNEPNPNSPGITLNNHERVNFLILAANAAAACLNLCGCEVLARSIRAILLPVSAGSFFQHYFNSQ